MDKPIQDRAKSIDIAQHVFELRVAGNSMPDVAAKLDTSVNNCYRAFDYWVRHLVTPKAEEARTYELAVLDRLMLALKKGIEAGDVKAVRTAVGISARRSELLGLDMPKQVQVRVQTVDAVDDEIMRLTAEMAGPKVIDA
jgi:hypothetical protein